MPKNKKFKESKDSNPIIIEIIQKIYDYSKEKYKKRKIHEPIKQ